METWRRYSALSAPERRLVRESAVCLTATWIALRLIGFRRMRDRIENSSKLKQTAPPAANTEAQLSTARSVARAESSAARHLFFSPNCLVQSLALISMLRRHGVESDLRIGARNDAGKFQAHAWVELNGIVLNDTVGEHSHFVPFEETGSAQEPHATTGTHLP
jgi:Transglutaminase-like superfamily